MVILVSFFPSKTVETKFYVNASGCSGTKIYTNGLGYMTKMAAMPIYGENFYISSSIEPLEQSPET